MDLTSYVNRHHGIICEFRDNHPDIWMMVESAFLASHTVANEILQTNNHFPKHEFQVLQFWKTTLDYLMESFILIVKKQFDLGLGCLRLASELVRNSSRILEKPELLKLLYKHGSPEVQGKMRKSFKFDLTKRDEQYLFKLYNICSTYGIHGHMTADMLRKPTLFLENHVAVSISDTEVLKMLEIWLKSFFPIQNQYVYYFGKRYKPQSGKPYAEMHKVYHDALASFEKNLKTILTEEQN